MYFSRSSKYLISSLAIGGSRDECTEIFAGRTAFSEPEAQALKNLMDSIGSHTIAYLNLHSYGQLWLWPWGYTTKLPSDVQDLVILLY
jgi:hypothetical protein